MLLDIGCADGVVTTQIIEKLGESYQLEVTGIETSTELIKCFSDIDISGIENMNENGKTIIEFFKHEQFVNISSDEINDIRNKILNIANGNKKLTKREDYIWIFKD